MMTHPNLRHSLLLTALSFSAHAAEWTGTTSTDYKNALNWNPQVVPVAATEVSIITGTPVHGGDLARAALTTVADPAAFTLNGRFQHANGGAATLNITGGSFTHTGNYFLGGMNNVSTIHQTGGTMTSTVDRGWFLSDADAGACTYQLDGGTLTMKATGGNDPNWNLHVGKGSGNDLFHFNGGTATFTATAANYQTYISKNGEMRVDAGSAAFNGMRYITVGRNLKEGSTSKLVINNGSLTAGTFDATAATAPPAFIVGENNAGEVQLNGGTLDISTASLWIGNGTRSGSFQQSGGILNLNGPGLIVGRNSAGALSVTGGTFNATLSGDMFIGNTNATDSMIVNGGEVNLTGTLGNRIYMRRDAVLQVDSGDMEVRNFQYFSVGRDTAGSAKVIVNGGRLEVVPSTDRRAAMVIGGQGGQGELTVTGGEFKVTTGQLWIGDGLSGKFSQSGGTATVEGPLILGNSNSATSPGTLLLEEGTLTLGSLQLPSANGSSARLKGGTLNLNCLRGSNSGTVYFDGTDVAINADPSGAAVMYQLAHADIGSGGLHFQLPAGQEASIDQLLEDSPETGATKDGGFKLSGGGTVYLYQPTAYTGRTEVSAGRLSFSFPSLDDHSEVVVAADGVLELTHSETDVVRRVVLNGQVLSTGIWGGPSSSAPNKHPLLDGSGLLQVTNGPEFGAYDSWILATGIAPALTGPDSDPDGDSVANIVEYAIGGKADDPLMRGVATIAAGGVSPIFTLAVASGASFQPDGGQLVATANGARYAIQGSTGLDAWDMVVEEVVPAVSGGLASPGSGFEFRSFRLSDSSGPRGFLRAEISAAP